MTQATGNSFFTQAMALATANTTSTALPELIAFMGNRLGQTRANQLLAKVGHLLTLEQQYTLQETYLYGSSRLGVKNQNTILSTRVASVQNGSLTPIGNAILNTDSVFTGPAAVYGLPKAPSSRIFNRTWGLKQYELSNHLGNVQVTVSDKKIGVLSSNQVDFIAYEPEVKSATDYYAYGMEMPGKTYQSTAYRYGMNTQEKDNEIYGPGNTLGALYWEYDARIARRWNLDPKPQIWLSDYSVLANNPIRLVDVLGDKWGKKGDKQSEQENKKQADEIKLDASQKLESTLKLLEEFAKLENRTEDDRNTILELGKQAAHLKSFIQGIDDLEKSEHYFIFQSDDLSRKGGGEIKDNKDGTFSYIMHYNSNSYGNKVHELVHPIQWLKAKNEQASDNPDLHEFNKYVKTCLREIQAYSIQFIFSPSSLPLLNSGNKVNYFWQIDNNYIQSIKDEKGSQVYKCD
jgi:hypothetical protein